MRQILLSSFILIHFCTIAQNDTLYVVDLEQELGPIKSSIQSLQLSNEKLKSELTILSTKLSIANDTIEDLRKMILKNSVAIYQTADHLGIQITNTEKIAKMKIDDVNQSLSKKSFYGIIGFLAAILLSVIFYAIQRKRQKFDKFDTIDKLNKTKSSIEENLLKHFVKQTELMETQLKLLEQQNNNIQASQNQEPDHSLALKVASEINLIERNIGLMDPGTKGLKQLVRSVSKLKDNLSANGYEIPELIGKRFHQGMKLIVTSSLPDENLEKGIEIITKVLIPQVNYNDKMIQAAQIEVSVGI